MPSALPEARAPEASPPSSRDVESLYRAHFRQVWSLLRRLGVQESQLDDAAQDVFIVVHRRTDQLQQATSAKAWVMGVAVRVASDYRRHARRHATQALPLSLPDHAPGPARQREIHEAVTLLHELLSTLDQEKREVFVLVELEQCTVVEAAEALSLNLNTVYSRIRAARRRFENALSRHRLMNSTAERAREKAAQRRAQS